MKRITKIMVALMLILGMLFSIPSEASAKTQKNIYFTGEYMRKIGPGEYYVLWPSDLSGNGKRKGDYQIYYWYKPSGGRHLWKSGNLKYVSVNRYKSGKMKFRIYKKKIVIANGGEYSGTYKLKRRYS